MQTLATYATPAAPATLAGAVILVQRDHPYHPFITAWRADGASSWCFGHYFETEAEARADFIARCQRGY